MALRLSFDFIMRFAPRPAITRTIADFERSLKGALRRVSEPMELPACFTDEGGVHRITIGPEAFTLSVAPLLRIDRFGPSATSLALQFLTCARSIAPREVELRAELCVPVPDPKRALGGYSCAAITWPRTLDLHPEELGKDHYHPCETGMVHVRLSTRRVGEGHELSLLIADRHDRVAAERAVIEQAYALALRGVQGVVKGIASPAYRRALGALLGQAPAG